MRRISMRLKARGSDRSGSWFAAPDLAATLFDLMLRKYSRYRKHQLRIGDHQRAALLPLLVDDGGQCDAEVAGR